MARLPEETAPSRAVQRESDNPIVEEFKEELLRRPSYGTASTLESEERLCRLEGLLAELLRRVDALEKAVEAVTARK
ncbi:MAG: hypothetical protein A4E48_02061 [Methanosaeta sp. PtaU1.Bin060]|nr:MAG: hypothetical protein A4E48_02061 [Methanosaeta sp. PtaU1.Bin060]